VFAATDSPTRRLHLVRFFDRVIANDHRLRCKCSDGVLYTGEHTQAGWEAKPVGETGFRFASIPLTDGACSLYRKVHYSITRELDRHERTTNHRSHSYRCTRRNPSKPPNSKNGSLSASSVAATRSIISSTASHPLFFL